MSTQRRGYFALKCDPLFHAETKALENFCFAGSMPFTLGTTFWLEEDDEQTIFSQDGVFSVKVQAGRVILDIKDVGTFTSKIDVNLKINYQEWNRLDIVCDTQKLSLYLQGNLLESFEIKKNSFIDKETRYKYGAMKGYMQTFELYDTAYTDMEVLYLSFKEEVDKEKTALYLDFDNYVPKDKGKNELSVQCIGACDTVDLVYGFKAGKSGYATPFGASKINPGGFDSKEFTLLTYIYAEDLQSSYDDEDPYSVIFANGIMGDKQSVSIGIRKDLGLPYVNLGTNTYSFKTKIDNYQWHQLGCSYANDKLLLYLDGNLDAEIEAAFFRDDNALLMIGNQSDAKGNIEHGFAGIIDTIAVFDKALTQATIKSFADITPYYFDSDLKAAWVFSEQYPREIIADGIISYASDTKINIPFENTINMRELPIFMINMPDVKQDLDEVEKWQNRTQAQIIIDSYSCLMGINPENGFIDQEQTILNGSLANLIQNELSNNEYANKICIEGVCSKLDIRDFWQEATFGALAGACIYGLYCTFQNQGWRRASLIRRFMYYFFDSFTSSPLPAIGSAIAAASGLVEKYIEEHESPDSQECSDDDFDITIQSIAFYDETNIDKGCLYGIDDFECEAMLPEWQYNNGKAEEGKILYYQNYKDDTSPILKVNIKCDKKCTGDLELALQAYAIDTTDYEDILGNIPQASIKIANSGNYTLSFSLTNNKIKKVKSGKHKIRWQWSVTHLQKEKLMGKTEHEIYILPRLPLSPWNIARNSKYPPVFKLMDIIDEFCNLSYDDENLAQLFMQKAVSWIHGNNKFVAQAWDKASNYAFSLNKYNTYLAFDISAFTNDYNKKDIVKVNDLDIAFLIMSLATLLGIDEIRTAKMVAYGFNDNFALENFYLLGNVAKQKVAFINAHYINTINDKVYDCFIKTDKLLSDLPFSDPTKADLEIVYQKDESYYDGSLLMIGCGAQISLNIKDFSFANKGLGKYIVVNGTLEIGDGRPGFSQIIKNYYALPSYQVRCHSLSYIMLEKIIYDLLRLATGRQIDAADLAQCFEIVLEAVFLTDDFGNGDAYCQAAYLNAINIVNGYTEMSAYDLASFGNKLLSNLNNSVNNLRLGYNDWNSSLQEYYDPIEWHNIMLIGEQYVEVANDQTASCFNVLNDGKLKDFDILGEGIYLSHRWDHDKVTNMYKVVSVIEDCSEIITITIVPSDILIDEINGLSDSRRWHVVSSNNNWRLKDHGYFPGEAVQLRNFYCLNDDGWIAI